jgi:hypothetical protein
MWPRRHGHDPGQATRTFLCIETRTYTPRVFVDIRAGIPAQDGGCYLALDSMTYQASCQGNQMIDSGQAKTYFNWHSK